MANKPPQADVPQKNLYRILEVTPASTSEEIHSQYRKLSKQYHPDLCQDKELGAAKMKEIVAAYNQLKEKSSRDLYDSNKMFRFRKYNRARSGMDDKPKGFFARLFAPKIDAKEQKRRDNIGNEFAMGLSMAEAKKSTGYKEAAAIFQSILKTQPRNPDLHYNIGLCCYFLGDFVNAVLSFNNALSIDKDFTDAKAIIDSLEI